MTNTFYIVSTEQVGGTWYNLCIKDSHYCISCGHDLDKIVLSLKNLVKRMRTKERLVKSLSRLEDHGKVSPATLQQRKDYYMTHSGDYADLVHSAVVDAIKESRIEDLERSPLRKTTKRLKKVGKIKTPEKIIEETPKDHPKFLTGKPKVFNRK